MPNRSKRLTLIGIFEENPVFQALQEKVKKLFTSRRFPVKKHAFHRPE